MAHSSEAIPCRIPFWSKPVSTFGLLGVTARFRRSHVLVVPIHPLRLSAFVLADSALPRGSAYRLSGGYVVPEASHSTVTGSACPGREQLMEQPVSSGHAYPRETEKHATCRSHDEVALPMSGQQSVFEFGRLHTNTDHVGNPLRACKLTAP